MKVLIMFNRAPYDGTDVTWNGLRLAGKLLETGQHVRIFLMNDAVDMARDACKAPEDHDQELVMTLKPLIARRVIVKVCGTCMARWGIQKNSLTTKAPNGPPWPTSRSGWSTATGSSPYDRSA